jgi:hypothetical protein
VATSAATKSENVKLLNRADLTRRLVAKLKHDEAVVAGIGNTNFDLYAAGHRPQNFYMLGRWASPARSRSALRWRSPSAA